MFKWQVEIATSVGVHQELCLRNLGIRKWALKQENLNMEWQNTCVHKNKKVRVGRPKFQLEFCQNIENKKVRVDWHTLEHQSPKMGPQKAPQALRWLENGTLKNQSPKMGLTKSGTGTAMARKDPLWLKRAPLHVLIAPLKNLKIFSHWEWYPFFS